MQEIWKVYIDNRNYKKDGTVFRGALWEISNFGNVKRNGVFYECKLSNGYKFFSNGYKVYRAVAELFIPNPENKPCVDHIDTNKLNDNVTNLRWVTHSENMNNPLTKMFHLDCHEIK